MNKVKTLAVFATAILTLSGCAVPYAKKGTQGCKGGFEDKELEPGRYAIEVEGNGFTSYEVAEQYFYKRAGELCAGKTYKHTLTRTTTQHTNFYFTPQLSGVTQHVFPVVIGEVTCDG